MTTRTASLIIPVVPTRTTFSAWLWPNVLSLEEPLVAVLWQLLVARSQHIHLNPFEPLALGFTVWLIYLADHVFDTLRPPVGEWEPPRKTFFRQHRTLGFALCTLAGFAALVCGLRWLFSATLRGGFELSFAVIGYFSLVHLTPRHWRVRWPREVVVSVVFTAGCFGALWLNNGRNLPALLPSALLFAALSWLNCCLIETREWQAAGKLADEAPGTACRWLAAHLTSLVPVLALACALLSQFSLLPRSVAAAGVLSSLALSLLAAKQRSVRIEFVSPLADLALYSPLLTLALT